MSEMRKLINLCEGKLNEVAINDYYSGGVNLGKDERPAYKGEIVIYFDNSNPNEPKLQAVTDKDGKNLTRLYNSNDDFRSFVRMSMLNFNDEDKGLNEAEPETSGEISYESVKDILQEAVSDGAEELRHYFELYGEPEVEEVEHKSRDGFIPFTDGGYQYAGFSSLNQMWSSGDYPSAAREGIEDTINQMLKDVAEYFAEKHPEAVEAVGSVENLNYHSLQEAGLEDLANELSEEESNWISEDGSVLFELGVYYYDIDNSHNDFEGKSPSIYVFGSIGWRDAPYHRKPDYNSPNNIEIPLTSIEDLKQKLPEAIKKVVESLK